MADIRGQPFGGACDGLEGRLFIVRAEYAPQTFGPDFTNALLISGSGFYGGAINLLLDGREVKTIRRQTTGAVRRQELHKSTSERPMQRGE
jgi:hypothetical protein